jgi:predicted nucleic acid-binding protein
MIVVDTNVIAYLLIPGDCSNLARAALRKDPYWVAPLLWRSEFRNVLTFYQRRRQLDLRQALQFMREAELLMQGGEYEIDSAQVLSLTANSKCSAYDCEFVALAHDLGIPLITSDTLVLSDFSPIAIPLQTYVS